VCWPDDSSYHLATAIDPGRRGRWLDLACGSAFAPLLRPELAEEIRGLDLNPRAVRLARLGAGLTGCRHLAIDEADIGQPHAPAALVTCNAPIVGDPDASIWRRADPGFFTRLWPAMRASVAPGGEAIVHSTADAIPSELAGEVVTVIYTPPGERGYAITWWQPDAPTRRITVQRALTPARPHLDPRDRDDARAGKLMPLDP
jgi:SAM-dependent methyltransferase